MVLDRGPDVLFVCSLDLKAGGQLPAKQGYCSQNTLIAPDRRGGGNTNLLYY